MVSENVVVSAFYRFVAVDDPAALRERLIAHAVDLQMTGSVLVAAEGINGTVAGSRSSTDQFFAVVTADQRFSELEIKESLAPEPPFRRMKVRLKKEIVTFRQPVDPTKKVGTYIDAASWNDVISDPDVLVIDTRNDEEITLGSFANAVNPDTETFTEFADYVAGLDPTEHPRVAMFCTGGIRCEKASSYMLDQGFGEVMHLEGGILKYLETVPVEDSLWEGECFVFDERVSVDHDLKPGTHTLCRGCRRPLSENDRLHARYEEGVSCRTCFDTLTDGRVQRLRERNRQELLAAARGERHIAQDLDGD